MEKNDYLVRKQKCPQLWWIPDDRFELLSDLQKEQLLNPSRTVLLPDIDVISDVLNDVSQVTLGMAALARKGLQEGRNIEPQMLNGIVDNLKVILGFLKAYKIAQ